MTRLEIFKEDLKEFAAYPLMRPIEVPGILRPLEPQQHARIMIAAARMLGIMERPRP